MIQSNKVIELTLKTNSNVAGEVAHAVLARSNPHASNLVEEKLAKAGIDENSLAKYFEQVSYVVAEFWNAQYDRTFVPTLKSHEVRGLYLPLIYSVIFASVGNIHVGNYEYRIKAVNDATVDKDWILGFSAKLEDLRDYILGDVNQIGNYNATPQTTVMMALMAESDVRSARISIRDGVTPDRDLAGLAALIGLTLVNEAYEILYTGVDEVNFRDLVGTIVQKKPGVTTKVEDQE